MDFVVSKAFRRRLLELVPVFKKGDRLWLRFFGYLAFAKFVDKRSGRLVIDHETIRQIA
jgi:hypothetical protein